LNLDFLLERYFAKPVAPVSVQTLKGDASSRCYYRVILPEGCIPHSMIVMALPENPLGSDEVSSGPPPVELPFIDVGRHLAQNGIRVPALYLDAVSDGALLLEDLGDRQLVDVVSGADEATVSAWYEAAVTLLSDMHDRMWPIPDTSIASARSFGFDLLRWELDHYREWGVEAVYGVLDTAVRLRLDEAFDHLAAEIDALPKGFVHRDYQSRNLMVIDDVPRKESLAVIDFQDAFQGPCIYDLVALLNDSYVDLTWDLKNRLIQRYARHRNLDAERLTEAFHLVTVQRKLKDGARFIFIDQVKYNPAYLDFVDTSFRRARTSLEAIPGHDQLRAALAAADPERFGG
jgi:N-acetylmuramate 1-kinase